MTQKELLYVEDAIGHEQSIIDICNESINNLQDDYLVSFMKREIRKHTNMYDLLLQLLENEANE